jgi:hypothetical protein
MAKKVPPGIPPNIKEFNEITAVIFSKLYDSFPVDRNLDPAEIAASLRVADINAPLPSARSFNLVLISTLGLLIREGFVHSYGNIQRERCVLATKAMAVMTFAPPGSSQPFGVQLAEATARVTSGDDKGHIAQMMGDFFGSFAGSFWKSMSGAG